MVWDHHFSHACFYFYIWISFQEATGCTEECEESKYWIEWTGTGSPGTTVLKLEITWNYNEYEYAK